MNQIFESQQTPHISPSRASYGMPIVRILEKIDCVITAPHCTFYCLQNGSTARDVARQQGHTAIAELLREYERQTKRTKRVEVPPTGRDESDSSESSSSLGEASCEASPQHRKLGPPPMCQDICASPKNSPKRVPRKTENMSNGEQR